MKKLIILLILFLSLLPFSGSSQGTASWDSIPEDMRNSKAFQRFEWFYQQRAFPYEKLPYDRYVQAVEKEIRKIRSNSSRSLELQWTSVGPTGVMALPSVPHWGVTSGRVRAVAVHPNDHLTVYMGAACGGLWKTTDGGETWMDIGNQLESQSFGAIAIDPSNPEVVFAGSGETSFFDGFIHFPGNGLFKSTDGGLSWATITDGFGDMTHFSDLIVSPHNSSLLFAALASGNCYAGGNMSNEGIWKSMDGGITWIRCLDVEDAFDVAVHPIDEDIVYCAIGGANDNSGFYISDDQGLTWTQSNTGLQTANTIARMHFDVAASAPDIIYSVIYQLGTGSFWTGTSRAYKSIDGGNTWSQISVGINLGGNNGAWMDQGFYDLCIAVDPVDPDHVFIGNIELHETTNGSVFAPVRPFGNNSLGSLVHPDYHKLIFAPSAPNYFYIGCDGGLYRSTDAGQTAISQNPGLETLQFYRIASHPTNPDILMGGMQDNGNGITLDGGATWQMTTSGDGMECLFDYADPDIVYASIQNGRLTKSYDGGNSYPSWIKFVNGAWITPFIMHPTEHNTIYIVNKSMHRSTDAGSTWEIIAQDVAPVNINTLAQSRINPDIMIFATGGGDTPIPDTVFVVKISLDGGFTWTDVTNNIPGEVRWISRVATDPLEENTMYVLRTGYSEENKLWKTTDLGESWTNISGDLPDLPCSDLFIDPDNTDHLYVANDIGVYLTTDGGINWEYTSYGMPFVPVVDFDYVKIGAVKYLRAGTYGRSIYQTNILGVGEEELIVQSSKFKIQSYPIPTQGIFNVQFTIYDIQSVMVKIYDIHGREMAMVLDKKLPAGEHVVQYDMTGMPAGVYVVEIRAKGLERRTEGIGHRAVEKVIKMD